METPLHNIHLVIKEEKNESSTIWYCGWNAKVPWLL